MSESRVEWFEPKMRRARVRERPGTPAIREHQWREGEPKRFPPQHGAIALLGMLILMAAALVISAGLSLRGLGNLQAVDLSHRGEEAFGGADGCVVEALRRLRDNGSYTGGTVTIGNTVCTITVTDDGGGRRTIRSAATRGSVTRHVRATAQLSTVIISGRTVNTRSVTSWEETLE